MSSATTDRVFSTPEEARRARHEEWSRTLKGFFVEHRSDEVSVAVVAAKLGFRSKSMLQRQLDDEHPDSAAIADVDAMPDAIAIGAATKIVSRRGYALVKLPAALTIVGAIEAVARIQVEAGEATLEAAKALADGRLDRAEAARLLRELNELISAALVIRTWCERALVEGVVTVDGGAR